MEINETLNESINDNVKEKLYCFNMENEDLSAEAIEILCKTIIMHIVKLNKNSNFYLALINCTEQVIVEITRMLTVFYNKRGINEFMQNAQIYLSGENPEKAFLFAGENLSLVLNRAEKLAIARGMQPVCFRILTDILQKRISSMSTSLKTEIAPTPIAPFELLIKNDGHILFEDILFHILDSDIQGMLTGCKLKETHVRLGSKIHLTEFYQAEILFQNNYFTYRFAYLIVEDMRHSNIDFCKIVLVGYETYSEMLLYELVQIIRENYNINVPYIIYEQRNGEQFQYIQELKPHPTTQYQFVYIVPINTTFTTHNKMQAALKRCRDDAYNVARNYGIIFFDQKNKEENYIKEDFGIQNIECDQIDTELVQGKKIKIFFKGALDWHNALECDYCFPLKYVDERPLIETNRASIIPMQRLELKEEIQNAQIMKDEDIYCDKEKIDALGECLQYDHIERGGNHFEYYFHLEAFFLRNRESIVQWLQDIEIAKPTEGKVCFDIIVAPQHYSNNGFVEEVNRQVFHNASLVLNIEVSKEFRSNVKAKYSNLLVLYNNLVASSRTAEMRFHYVDDTIVSGNTFYRAKSIIRSIFPKQLNEKVCVVIFKSVILLLDRSSDYSRMAYNEDLYKAYVKLHISSMRTQEDACVLCKIVDEANDMKELSATHKMCEYWKQRIKNHSCKEASIFTVNIKEQEKQIRAIRRMKCSHYAQLALHKYTKNKKQPMIDKEDDIARIRKCIIDELLLSNQNGHSEEDRIEYILSYLKVISRPFFNFSADIRKVIFKILLQLLDYMLGNREIKQEAPDLKEVLKYINTLNNNEQMEKLRYVMLITLIKRLSNLGSTFIIRKENIKRILKYYPKDQYDFELKYRACIKRLTCLSGDEIKGTWLEYLLLSKEEYKKTEDENIEQIISDNSEEKADSEFYNLVYIENTRVFRDAIYDLTKKTRVAIEFELYNGKKTKHLTNIPVLEKVYGELKKNYYYKNFEKIFIWNFGEEKELLDSICNFYIFLLYGSYKYKDIVVYYSKLAEYLCKVTNARAVQIILQDESGYYNINNASNDIIQDLQPEFRTAIMQQNYNDNTYYLDGDIGIIGISHQDIENDVFDKVVYLCCKFKKEEKNINIRYLRNILMFRYEIIRKFDEDFSTNAIQSYLAAAKITRLLSQSNAVYHGYSKTVSGFLDKARNAAKLFCNLKQFVVDDLILPMDLAGYLYVIVANTIISMLFQKAISGRYKISKDQGEIHKIDKNIFRPDIIAPIVKEQEFIHLYIRTIDGKLRRCEWKSKISDEELEKYYMYSTDDNVISAIFVLLILNAYKHVPNGEDPTMEISIQEEENNRHQIVFSNKLIAENPEDKRKEILKKVQAEKYDSKNGITLWTLDKYYKFMAAHINGSEMKIFLTQQSNEYFINIALPIYKREDDI